MVLTLGEAASCSLVDLKPPIRSSQLVFHRTTGFIVVELTASQDAPILLTILSCPSCAARSSGVPSNLIKFLLYLIFLLKSTS